MHIWAHRPYIVYMLCKTCIPYNGKVWTHSESMSPFKCIDIFVSNQLLSLISDENRKIFYLFCIKRHTMHIGAHRPYIVYMLCKSCIPYNGKVWTNAESVSPFTCLNGVISNRLL